MTAQTAEEPARIAELSAVTREQFDAEIVDGGRPVVMRGLIKEWPATLAALSSPSAMAEYLRSRENGAAIETLIAPPHTGGRHFYDAQMRGFNFQRHKAPLAALLNKMLELADDPEPMTIYAGSVPASTIVPSFADENPMPLLPPSIGPRLWIGNRSRVAAHFDVDRNIACAVSGARQFTLFPPDQIANLYVGPLDFNMAGPSTSLVDFANPDFDRHPRFANALDAAIPVDLQPGDALFIPAYWWHHVVADGPFNLLVNYWWPAPNAGPAREALALSLLAIRDLPKPERNAWRSFFDHYIFGEDAASAADHIPSHARTVLGPPDPQRSRAILEFVRMRLGALQ